LREAVLELTLIDAAASFSSAGDWPLN